MTNKRPRHTTGQQKLSAYSAALHDYLMQRLRANHQSTDLAQEVHQRLARIDRAELASQPVAVIYSLSSQVVNERKAKGSRPSTAAPDVARSDPSDAELQQQVTALLAKLTVAHRAILLLNKRDKRSIEDIAQDLNIPAHKVQRYLTEAKRPLEELLGNH